LHVDRNWLVVLVGGGDLGQAIAHYGGFASKGFYIEAIFDNDQTKLGQKVIGKTVQDIINLGDVIRELQIKMAIVSVPASAAQAVSDKLVESGVRAILNYAPITLTVPDYVQVQYIDPVVHLQRMTYYLA